MSARSPTAATTAPAADLSDAASAMALSLHARKHYMTRHGGRVNRKRWMSGGHRHVEG
jgi:hypothetical protein